MLPFEHPQRDDRDQDLADYLAYLYQDSIEQPLRAKEDEEGMYE
ncbi:MAG TPA: hypothetical protein VGE21_06160 [Flavobacteriales bacterium]